MLFSPYYFASAGAGRGGATSEVVGAGSDAGATRLRFVFERLTGFFFPFEEATAFDLGSGGVASAGAMTGVGALSSEAGAAAADAAPAGRSATEGVRAGALAG